MPKLSIQWVFAPLENHRKSFFCIILAATKLQQGVPIMSTERKRQRVRECVKGKLGFRI